MIDYITGLAVGLTLLAIGVFYWCFKPYIDSWLHEHALGEEYETKIHYIKLICSDLENWMNKTHFADIDYLDGELYSHEHIDPDLYYFADTKKTLKRRNAYKLWTNGVKTSNKLKNEGEKAIKAFHDMIDKELEIIPLKKSPNYGLLPVPSYSHLWIRQSIFDGINNIKNLKLSLEGRVLKDGPSNFAHKLANGKPENLIQLKGIIENLVENEVMKENIRSFNNAKEKLDWKDPFKEFQEKLDEITRKYEWNYGWKRAR